MDTTENHIARKIRKAAQLAQLAHCATCSTTKLDQEGSATTAMALLAFLAAFGGPQDRVARDTLLPALVDLVIYGVDQLRIRHAGLVRDTVWKEFDECASCSFTLARCSFARLCRLRRWRVSGRPVVATSHERRNELFSIEAEARPNHSAVFTLGCRAILAPITYSFQIGFGLASQGIDREPLPSLPSDGF